MARNDKPGKGIATASDIRAGRVPLFRSRGRSTNGAKGDAQVVELIAMLNDVADAVASTLDIDGILSVIAERTRRATDAQKVAILLLDDATGETDLDTLVVKGMRSQHPQPDWEERLERLIDPSLAHNEIHFDAGDGQTSTIVCVPMRLADEPIGVIGIIDAPDREYDVAQVDTLAVLASFAASAIQRAQVAEQARTLLVSSERERIASEIHDGPMQSLFSTSLGMEVCKKQIYQDPSAVYRRLDEMQDQLKLATAELRRCVYDLKPASLTQLGLTSAIQSWIREVTVGTSIRGRISIEGDAIALSPRQEQCLYRVAKEAVSNAVKHAGASHVDVRLMLSDSNVRMTISDDGSGFVPGNGASIITGGMGLRSIQDRVDNAGGTLGIESEPSQGTRITVDLPMGRR